MGIGCTNLTQTVRLVQLLKINGWSMTTAVTRSNGGYLTSSWNVHGYKWVVIVCPAFLNGSHWVALRFIFLGGVVGPSGALMAKITCRLVDPTGNVVEPSEAKTVEKKFLCSGSSIYVWLIKTCDVRASGYLVDDSLTVRCSITVLKDLKHVAILSQGGELLPAPSCDMHRHFGELLQRQTGSDVTFVVSGVSFAAHKLVLAARSPVFMAEFFGNNMEERSSSQCVQEIEGMEAAVFKAMLHFIYTDTVPELDEEEDPEVAVTMARHLLAAAVRYGLERLKVICQGKLSNNGVDVRGNGGDDDAGSRGAAQLPPAQGQVRRLRNRFA